MSSPSYLPVTSNDRQERMSRARPAASPALLPPALGPPQTRSALLRRRAVARKRRGPGGRRSGPCPAIPMSRAPVPILAGVDPDASGVDPDVNGDRGRQRGLMTMRRFLPLLQAAVAVVLVALCATVLQIRRHAPPGQPPSGAPPPAVP